MPHPTTLHLPLALLGLAIAVLVSRWRRGNPEPWR